MKIINGERIFTHDSDGERGWEKCQCVECKIVAVCTPGFDFYVSAHRTDDALVCEPCAFRSMFGNREIKQVLPDETVGGNYAEEKI
jgi:hypothetical protein